MKPMLRALALLCLPLSLVQADNYLDATGDSTTVNSLDITSVDVFNDGSTLSLQINLADNPLANDWGKYLVGIDTMAGGNTTGPDPWGKPISMSEGGMDYFIGSWLNFGTGAEVLGWSGSTWDPVAGSGIGIFTGASSVTLSLNLSALGLTPGSAFNFDVYSTSDGNSALDAAGSAIVLTWNNDPYDSGLNVLGYTVVAVPEPAVPGLLAMGLALLAWRRRPRNGQ